MTKHFAAAAALLAALTLSPVSAEANPGDPDSSFTNTGISDYDATGALARLPGGGLVLAGDSNGRLAATELDAHGKPVKSFGKNGTATALVGTALTGRGRSVLALANGKVLVAGSAFVTPAGATTSERQAALVRFTKRGAIDTTFGDNGRVLLHISGADSEIFRVLAAPGGRLLVAGRSDSDTQRTTPDLRMFVARLTASGNLDTAFGTAGISLAAPSGATASAYDMARLPDGRIILAGYSTRGGRDSATAARVLPDGKLDTTFGSQGFAIVASTLRHDDGRFYNVVPTSGGRIVLAGQTLDSDGFDENLIARLGSGGARDTRFGQSGVVHDKGKIDGVGPGLAVQRDGKVLVAGVRLGAYAVRRYTAKGARDFTFGEQGIASQNGAPLPEDADEVDDFPTSLLLDSAGRIVVAGTSITEEDRLDFSDAFGTVVRFEGGTLLVRVLTGGTRAGRSSVRVRLECSTEAARRCAGTLRLRTATKVRLGASSRKLYRTLGSTRFSIAKGANAPVDVPLTAAGRVLTSGRTQRSVRVIADAHDTRGARGVTRRVITVKPSG